MFKARDPSPERRRSSVKKDSTKAEKSERRDRDRDRISHRKGSTKDRTTSRTSGSPTRPSQRSSMPGATDSEGKTVSSRASESKSSLPYPTFSKAHSKESIGSREAVRPTLDIFTPPATDVNASKEKITNVRSAAGREAPPSPPLTEQNVGTNRRSPAKKVEVETILEEDRKSTQESRPASKAPPKTSKLNGHVRSNSELGTKQATSKSKAQDRVSTPLKTMDVNAQLAHRSVSQPIKPSSPVKTDKAIETATNLSSNATSIAPEQPQIQRPGSMVPPGGLNGDTGSQVTSIQGGSTRNPTPLEIFIEDDRGQSTTPGDYQPPPPPPPPAVPISIPKVDYLLQNGGLNQSVPKSLLLAGKPMVIQQAALSPGQPQAMIANLFEPYNQLLDDFEKVVSKNGSLAVATGYRSVARRLLDRLEAVFARDISCETCQCCMCTQQNDEVEENRGVSWGEILEMVSGRRDLPSWPPFSLNQSPVGLGISLENPMQKLDIDVPEEYREHYIRQSQKTKKSVDKWLHRQNDGPTSPPEEVDDETLLFAILTHLPAEQRPTLTNLLGIVQGPIEPPRRAPSPDRDKISRPPSVAQARVRPVPILTAGSAIQRLYRLGQAPRDPETAIFMLNNPSLHNALATLAAISDDEWDILISGRFDGFLRSGAEDLPPDLNSMRAPSHKPMSISRGPTPLRMNGHSRHSSFPSRGATPANGGAPAQFGAPVAFDEETEIATLAEIERNIYVGMEALEDAFETLHQKAEVVRKALRERSAGLAAAAQRRRGSMYGPEVRGGTPASMNGYDRWENETDDGLGDWDGTSELAPDDSASNISSSRRRRPKRRNERRTPVVVLEEDESESYAESEGTASPVKEDGGRERRR